ncbi:MAG: M23 family metallopeptidase [Bacteroidales bacterium]|nr:M23 family metallopeptidase [Bacteroidales bacterium]
MKTFLNILKWVGICFGASLVLSVIYYVVCALIFSTDVEKELMDENRLFRRELPKVEAAATLVEQELDILRMRDENIYREVFKTDLPHLDDMLESRPADDALETADRIERCWRQALDSLMRPAAAVPPMIFPITGLVHTNVGASTGERMNPFYKVKAHHDGIDLVAPEGTVVYATAPGFVTKVQKTEGGKGNMVEITHNGGYVTRYAHLSEIMVKSGIYVSRGRAIGKVGSSGRSFTTHLHYEILYDGEVMDPTHFFFGSLTPEEYLNFLIMSTSSGQSMD